ncbi:MAG TPA: DNA primase [Patescibacteria group bacterium]|nr:DNA primase [Patescibacteria group bacterium]
MTTAEEIKQKLDLIDVVGEYVRLTPAGGQSMRGLCPFHGEKTPSFYAHRDKQFWHCFGCSEGGDVFTFYQKMENVDFRDALKELARRAGVQLPEFDPKADSERAAALSVLEDASRYYEAALKHAAGTRAQAYLAKRGVKPETVAEFRIGYAPATWDSAVKALQGKGHSIDSIMAAGLAIPSDKNRSHYDRFRDRIMIPLRDEKGTVVGFTGRILPDSPEAEKSGKYVNTPETIVYKKRKLVYALDRAKNQIKKADFAVLVEGNMDAVSSHEAGVKNVVAVSGTAFSTDQIDILKRYCTRIALAFDADIAGQNAAARALPHAWKNGLQVMVVTLPPGFKDPDEVIRKDPQLWVKAITGARDMIEYSIEQAIASVKPQDAYGKRKAIQSLKPVFDLLEDPVLRDHWIHETAQKLLLTDDGLREALAAAKKPAPAPAVPAAPAPKIESRDERLAARLFCLMLNEPELFSAHAQALDDRFPEGPMRNLAKFLKAQYTDSGKAPSLQALREAPGLPPIEPILLLKDRDMAEWTPEQLTEEAAVCARELEKAATKRTEKELVGALAEAEQRGDRATATQIAKRLEDVAKRSHN